MLVVGELKKKVVQDPLHYAGGPSGGGKHGRDVPCRFGAALEGALPARVRLGLGGVR